MLIKMNQPSIDWQRVDGVNGHHYLDGVLDAPEYDLMTEADYFHTVDRLLDRGVTGQVLVEFAKLWEECQGRITNTVIDTFIGRHLDK